MTFGKRQLMVAAMVAALGTAVYLNWQFSGVEPVSVTDSQPSESVSKNLGQTTYVNTEVSGAKSEKSEVSKSESSKAEKVKELTADALIGAEKYFESVADMMSVDTAKCKVERGYYLTMNIDIRRDGVRNGGEEEACFVYIKDEGWKYVPVEPSELIELLERDSESEPEEVPAARSDD